MPGGFSLVLASDAGWPSQPRAVAAEGSEAAAGGGPSSWRQPELARRRPPSIGPDSEAAQWWPYDSPACGKRWVILVRLRARLIPGLNIAADLDTY
jgi:hypothetical protein